jgi:hypothetical protein
MKTQLSKVTLVKSEEDKKMQFIGTTILKSSNVVCKHSGDRSGFILNWAVLKSHDSATIVRNS